MAQVAYIGLGSNLGDGRRHLQSAWQYLGNLPKTSLLALSSPYRSSPVGIQSSHWFTNAVGKIATGLSAEQLLQGLLRIELQMGRQRELGRDREIDLDLVLYGSQIIMSPGLSVPHPQMRHRLFVLEPLCELDAELIHPGLGKTVRELRDAVLQDPDQFIQKFSWLKEERP